MQSCYGWDLIELIRILKDRPVKGVIIGDGSGLPILQAHCREYGIADRVLFLGRRLRGVAPTIGPHRRLPFHPDERPSRPSAHDGKAAALSGRRPVYLGQSRGGGRRILDEDMLVEYDGNNDLTYPQKLAERVLRLLDRPELLGRGLKHVVLARERFDYAVLARKMAEVIDGVVAGR